MPIPRARSPCRWPGVFIPFPIAKSSLDGAVSQKLNDRSPTIMAINFKARQNRWELLNTNIKPHLEVLPKLKEDQEELERVIQEDMRLAAQQSQLTGAVRDVVVQRNKLARRGNQVRLVLAAALRLHLGPDNPLLIEFGIAPFVPPKRRPKPVVNSEVPARAAPPATTAE